MNAMQQDKFNLKKIEISEILNAEIVETSLTVQSQANRMGLVSTSLQQCADAMSDSSHSIFNVADNVAQEMGQIQSATEQVATFAQEIETQVSKANSEATDASADAGAAYDVISTLVSAAEAISDIVEDVQSISSKTRILALNANIEAERAGQAGLGFAVVAAEVKDLAAQTEEAMLNITEQTEAIRNNTTEAAVAIEKVRSSVASIAESTHEVSESTAHQSTSSQDIKLTIDRLTTASSEVKEKASELLSRTDSVTAVSQRLEETRQFLDTSLIDTQQRFETVLKADYMGQFTQSKHQKAHMAASLEIETGETFDGYSMTLSTQGGLLSVPMAKTPVQQMAQLTLNGTYKTTVIIRSVTSLGAHITFADDALTESDLEGLMSEVTSIEQPLIRAAKQTAHKIGRLLEDAIKNGTPEDHIFDEDYRIIEGSTPFQYHTKFDSVTDELFPDLQEALLKSDDRIIFTCAQDRNGYIPTHNLQYAQPQRPDDPVWNAANCRTKRIFDDRAGLAASWNTEPCLVQCYKRDMGGGVFVYLKEFDAPITVNGKHWGGYRMGTRA